MIANFESLADLLAALGLTQLALAEKAGLTVSVIAKMTRGEYRARPRYRSIGKVHDAVRSFWKEQRRPGLPPTLGQMRALILHGSDSGGLLIQ